MAKVSNRKYLKSTRQHLRNNSTSAEAELWKYLRKKQLEGRKFRRQYSIENSIVDFCCPGEMIVIELDGDSHGDYAKIEEDISRDRRLMELGYRVVRFENRFVFQEPEWVLDEIKKMFNS